MEMLRDSGYTTEDVATVGDGHLQQQQAVRLMYLSPPSTADATSPCDAAPAPVNGAGKALDRMVAVVESRSAKGVKDELKARGWLDAGFHPLNLSDGQIAFPLVEAHLDDAQRAIDDAAGGGPSSALSAVIRVQRVQMVAKKPPAPQKRPSPAAKALAASRGLAAAPPRRRRRRRRRPPPRRRSHRLRGHQLLRRPISLAPLGGVAPCARPWRVIMASSVAVACSHLHHPFGTSCATRRRSTINGYNRRSSGWASRLS